MARVFIGVGSNQGDRLANISQAIQRLAASPECQLIQMATIQETTPMGGPPQGPFLNTVVELRTSLSPGELLKRLKQIEQEIGRQPQAQRWGPRPIDLDILLYDHHVIREPELTIPHEQMPMRSFVLEPLAQLAPDFIHPVLGRSVLELLQQLAKPPSPPA